jgi:hypothetical protein
MSYYNSYLLDELHRLFPAILYDNTRFQNNELVQYIRQRMREVYNLYDAATTTYASTASQRESDQSSTSSSFQVPHWGATPPNRSGRRHNRRRNAIYSNWRMGSEQSVNRMNTPVSEPDRTTSPQTTGTSPGRGSSEPSPQQEQRAPLYTVRSFLDSATQDATNDTLTAILGLLSLPSGGGSISVEPLLSPNLYTNPLLQYPTAQYGYYAPSQHHIPVARQRTPTTQDQSWAEILASFMNPIPIRPTQEQIDRATRLYITDASSARDSCVICFEAISDGQAQREICACSHAFHRDCIDRHFQTSPRCPLCRHDIRETMSATATATAQPPRGGDA